VLQQQHRREQAAFLLAAVVGTAASTAVIHDIWVIRQRNRSSLLDQIIDVRLTTRVQADMHVSAHSVDTEEMFIFPIGLWLKCGDARYRCDNRSYVSVFAIIR